MPSVYRQKNNIVPAIRGCAKSAAPDVLYAARIDVYSVPGGESRYLFRYCCASPPSELSMAAGVLCMADMSVIYFLSLIFEPLLAAYTIDLPHRFLVSVVSAPDLNGIGIMDDPVQNGIRNGRG